jgi:hypothetical protein
VQLKNQPFNVASGHPILPRLYGHPRKRFDIATGGDEDDQGASRRHDVAPVVQYGVQAACVAARGKGRRVVGDCYQNAPAETINGLYKAEVIHRRSWQNREAVEQAVSSPVMHIVSK